MQAGDPRTAPCDAAFIAAPAPGLGKFCSGGTVPFSRTDDDLTPSVTLQYDWTDGLMTYFSFSQGFKAGGFDQRANTVQTFEDVSFGPEEVDAFEVGAKTTWLNGALDVNLALFRMEYTDLQVSSLAPGSVSGFVVTNAASAISQGVEIDARWALGRGFTLSSAVSYLDGTFDEWRDGPCSTFEIAAGRASCNPPPGQPAVADRSGDDLPFAPDFSGHVALDYAHNFANGVRLDARLMLSFMTEVHHRIDNDPRLVEEGYTKLDARVGVSRGPWSLGLVGRNLTDETTTNLSNSLVASSSSEYRQLDRDRHVLLQAGYTWR